MNSNFRVKRHAIGRVVHSGWTLSGAQAPRLLDWRVSRASVLPTSRLVFAVRPLGRQPAPAADVLARALPPKIGGRPPARRAGWAQQRKVVRV